MEQREKIGKLSGVAGIVCNLLVASLKLAAGVASGAVSVVADAVNNFSDACSSLLSLIGFALAARPADDDHPFGHARYEYLSSLAIAVLVLMAGFELLKSSVSRLFSPEPAEYSGFLFAALIFSICVKTGMAVVNYRLGKKYNALPLIATAEDSRNDVLSTLAVLLGALITHFTGKNLDGIIGVLVSLFILYGAVSLLRQTCEPLLGRAPTRAEVDEIRHKIMTYPKVLGTHDLMLHDYGPGHRFASVHVEMPAEEDPLQCHEIIDTIERDFKETENLHLVIHYDPISSTDPLSNELRHYLQREAQKLDPSLSTHDLRIVPGEHNTNVIFDCVVPHSCPLKEGEVIRRLTEALARDYPHCTPIISIDHSFVSMEH